MRFERIAGHGPGTEFRIFDDDREIGYIRDGAVGFAGFETMEDAAQAAQVVHRALEQRRARSTWGGGVLDGYYVWEHPDGPHVIARSGLLARLIPPAEDRPDSAWGLEVPLLPEERGSVFAMSRARTMWNALQWSGIGRRMRHQPMAASAR